MIEEQEASMKSKWNAMELCEKLIPMMNESEIQLIGIALNKTVERLMREGERE